MIIKQIKDQTEFAESKLHEILCKIHLEGPICSTDLELLSCIKLFHPSLFKKYEHQLLHLLGLFYKTNFTETTLTEKVYSLFAKAIETDTNEKFTPIQASAYKEIKEKRFFSFSAPTSSGKSFLFRKLIQEYDKDIIIVVPSRALIAEYIYKVQDIVDKDVLVLQFVENINIKNIKRRVYIITPERGDELFQKIEELNVGLFLFDEAQISEEAIRGMKFDAFVRRVDKKFPEAKKCLLIHL